LTCVVGCHWLRQCSACQTPSGQLPGSSAARQSERSTGFEPQSALAKPVATSQKERLPRALVFPTVSVALGQPYGGVDRGEGRADGVADDGSGGGVLIGGIAIDDYYLGAGAARDFRQAGGGVND
jgi:hypothetical protein